MRIRPLNKYELAQIKRVDENTKKIQEFCNSRGCSYRKQNGCGYYGGCDAEREFEKTLVW